MNRLKALVNPFALVAQGFVAGAVLFLSTSPVASHSLLQHATHIAAKAPTR
jgi:hypothetical protein